MKDSVLKGDLTISPPPPHIIMAIIPDGCILIARKVMESDIWSKPAWWYKIFSYIIMEVSYLEEGKNKRGSSFFQYKTIFRECNLDKEKTWKGKISPKSIDNVVRWMREVGICTTTRTTRGIWITLCNYKLYQDMKNYQNDKKNEYKTTHKRHINDTISKESNKDKNVKNKITTLLNEYITLKGWEEEVNKTKGYLSFMYKRNTKPIEQLLEFVEGDCDKALAVMRNVAKWLVSKRLEWTIETVLKNLPKGMEEHKWYGEYLKKEN